MHNPVALDFLQRRTHRGRDVQQRLFGKRAGFFQQGLFKTSYACITCASRAPTSRRMSMKQFLAANHVVVKPEGREHALDRLLEELNEELAA